MTCTSSRHFAPWRAVIAAATAACLGCAAWPSIAAGRLVWLAGQRGGEGNLDGPVATATWGGGPLMLQADGDGVLVVDQYGDTLRRIDGRGSVTTLAGKAGESGRADGDSRTARLSWPTDAVRGPDGRLYVADTNNDAIRIIDADGKVDTLQPSAPEQAITMERPKALAFDGERRLWVVPKYAGKLLMIAADGRLTQWAPDESPRSPIVDIAKDHQGQLWGITAESVGRIRPDRFEVVASLAVPEWRPPIGYRVMPPRDGPVAARWGQAEFIGRAPLPPEPTRPDAFTPPEFRALSIGHDGGIYIAEARRILRLAPGGTELKALFQLPQESRSDGFTSIAALQGDVLVSAGREGIYRLDAMGIPRPHAGADQGLLGMAADPRPRVEVDDAALRQRDGSLLFLKRLDHTIGRVDPQGNITRWAGDDERGRNDGPRLEARFRFPSDIVQDRAGNIYVADRGNALIRRIAPDGHVISIAGDGLSTIREHGADELVFFQRPTRLALDEANKLLYVLDSGGHTALSQMNLVTGELKALVERTGDPVRMEEGTLVRVSSAGLSVFPDYEDIAIGANGTLYALDRNLGGPVVWQIDPADGKHSLVFAEGPNPARDAHHAARESASPADRERMDNRLVQCDWLWCSPQHIEADARGHVYLSDTGNHTLIRIQPDGTAGVIAGRPGRRGNLDGALPGGLNAPSGLGWTHDGALMINTRGSGIMLLHEPHKAPLLQRIPALE